MTTTNERYLALLDTIKIVPDIYGDPLILFLDGTPVPIDGSRAKLDGWSGSVSRLIASKLSGRPVFMIKKTEAKWAEIEASRQWIDVRNQFLRAQRPPPDLDEHLY